MTSRGTAAWFCCVRTSRAWAFFVVGRAIVLYVNMYTYIYVESRTLYIYVHRCIDVFTFTFSINNINVHVRLKIYKVKGPSIEKTWNTHSTQQPAHVVVNQPQVWTKWSDATRWMSFHDLQIFHWHDAGQMDLASRGAWSDAELGCSRVVFSCFSFLSTNELPGGWRLARGKRATGYMLHAIMVHVHPWSFTKSVGFWVKIVVGASHRMIWRSESEIVFMFVLGNHFVFDVFKGEGQNPQP